MVPEEAEVVRRIFAWHAEGKNLPWIARRLQADNGLEGLCTIGTVYMGMGGQHHVRASSRSASVMSLTSSWKLTCGSHFNFFCALEESPRSSHVSLGR